MDPERWPWLAGLPEWAQAVMGMSAWVGVPTLALLYVLGRILPALDRLTEAVSFLAAQQAALNELVRLALR